MKVEDMKKYAIIIGALAVIVLTLIAVVTGYSKEVRTDTTTGVDQITLAANNTATSLGSSYPYVQAVTGCINDSDVAANLSTNQYTVQEGSASGGSITLNNLGANWTASIVNCSSVRYLADSDAQAAGDGFVTGITVFATFVGVVILAIIGVIIVSLYKKKE